MLVRSFGLWEVLAGLPPPLIGSSAWVVWPDLYEAQQSCLRLAQSSQALEEVAGNLILVFEMAQHAPAFRALASTDH